MARKRLEWTNDKRVVSDLIEYEFNPRKISDDQMEDLKSSLERFNLAEPLIIDKDGTLVSGHQRCKALVLLGRGGEKIDVRIPNRKLTQQEFKEMMIRFNRQNGEADLQKLNDHFEREILLAAGMTQKEIEDLLGAEEPIVEEEDPENFAIPEMELKAFEKYDYVVFVFKNEMDWMNVQQEFGLERVNASFSAKTKKIGLGRVIEGKSS